MADILPGEWVSFATVARKQYRCGHGHCDANVGSTLGYQFQHEHHGSHWAVIRICPLCNRPTYFEGERQSPGVSFGGEVKNVSPEVGALYDEARKCTAASAYTAAVLSARKILMNIAVDQGADEGKSFVEYVQYLSDKGFVPPNGKGWVDYIRRKGNEANHEIAMMERADAEELLTFVEMLLKFIYEFPGRVPKTPTEG